MRYRICASRLTLAFVLPIVFAFATFADAGAQERPGGSDELSHAVRLYNDGQYKDAVNELRSVLEKEKTNGDAWCYLGLALIGVDDMKSARKAFESALAIKPQLGPAHTGLAYVLLITGMSDDQAFREATTGISLSKTDAMAHYLLGVVQLRRSKNNDALAEADTAIVQNAKYAPSYLLKSQALLGIEGDESANNSKVLRVPNNPTPEELKERAERRKRSKELFHSAAEALQTYLTIAGPINDSAMWKDQLETLRIFAGDHKPETPRIVSGSQVATKARVLSKPEPTYTEQARHAGIEGTVILRAVFTEEGKVEHVLALRSLPGGLTERAIAAAKRINFVPATINGKPVAMIVELRYNFHLN
jgi:TonB family protein